MERGGLKRSLFGSVKDLSREFYTSYVNGTVTTANADARGGKVEKKKDRVVAGCVARPRCCTPTLRTPSCQRRAHADPTGALSLGGQSTAQARQAIGHSERYPSAGKDSRTLLGRAIGE